MPEMWLAWTQTCLGLLVTQKSHSSEWQYVCTCMRLKGRSEEDRCKMHLKHVRPLDLTIKAYLCVTHFQQNCSSCRLDQSGKSSVSLFFSSLPLRFANPAISGTIPRWMPGKGLISTMTKGHININTWYVRTCRAWVGSQGITTTNKEVTLTDSVSSQAKQRPTFLFFKFANNSRFLSHIHLWLLLTPCPRAALWKVAGPISISEQRTTATISRNSRNSASSSCLKKMETKIKKNKGMRLIPKCFFGFFQLHFRLKTAKRLILLPTISSLGYLWAWCPFSLFPSSSPCSQV